MNIINLQERRIRKMADSHDAFRVAAALLGEPYRAKNHKPAPVSKERSILPYAGSGGRGSTIAGREDQKAH